MRAVQITIFASSLFMSCALVGCGEATARVEPPPPKVSVRQPVNRDLTDYDSYNGNLDSPGKVEVRARVRGHIVSVHFTDGQMVKKGDLLFELDPRPFQADVDHAKAELKVFEAQSVAADREEARLTDLLKKGGASQTQVDKAQADAASLKAQIDAQKEDIRRRQQDLDYSRVSAEVAGKIGKAELNVGNLVNAGGSDPLLTTIVPLDPIYAYFNVDERSLQQYKKNHPSSSPGNLKEANIPFLFGLDTDEGYPYSGVLDFADNKVDPATGTILVRGEAKNDKGIFVPGSRVRIRIPVSDPHSALLVPDTAILSDQDKKYVLVIDDKNVVQRRDVALGKLLDDGSRVILPPATGEQGISTKDWIVTQGLQSARINYPVDPVKPTTQPAATQPI